MKNILQKPCILELNKSWMPISLKTPKSTLINLSNGNLQALHIDWASEDIEREDFTNPTEIRPVSWDEWITLPVRDYDLSIRTVNGEIRVPNIVVCSMYNKIPNIAPKISKKNIMLRDNYTCQFTGKSYDKKELNIDHVIPKSRGGKNTWENLVTCHRGINTKKGNKTPEEAGLQLIRKPFKPTTFSLFLNSKLRDPKWDMFLKGV